MPKPKLNNAFRILPPFLYSLRITFYCFSLFSLRVTMPECLFPNVPLQLLCLVSRDLLYLYVSFLSSFHLPHNSLLSLASTYDSSFPPWLGSIHGYGRTASSRMKACSRRIACCRRTAESLRTATRKIGRASCRERVYVLV